MKKYRSVFLIALALAMAGIVSSVQWREPWYHLRPISYWLAKYGDGPGDYKPSTEADHALRQMGSNAVPYLLKLLHSTNSYSYYTVVGKDHQRGIFPVVAPPASRVGGRLKAWSINLRSRFQRVTVPASWKHWKAYLAFQALGPEAKSAIPDLVKLASDPSDPNSPSYPGGVGINPEVASIGLWKDKNIVAVFVAQSSTYTPNGSPVFPVPIVVLGGGGVPPTYLSDGEIAAWSLAAIGADSVPPLMGMLTNSDPRIRCRAAMALGMMGKSAEPAVPVLVKMLDDPDGNTRRKAADALGCIGEQPGFVVPALISALDHYSGSMQFSAIESLGALGERATNAIPALLTLFQTEYNYSLDQTRGQYMIGYIATAMNKISPEVTRKEVIPYLISRIQNPKSPWNQSMTLYTLSEMTNQPDLVIPTLLDALDSADNATRNTMIYRLGDFGPVAKAAIPKLVPFSTSADTNLCRVATEALDKIDPGWRTAH